ncbi:hypothetical protein D3C72_2201500 [compost metagenome]
MMLPTSKGMPSLRLKTTESPSPGCVASVRTIWMPMPAATLGSGVKASKVSLLPGTVAPVKSSEAECSVCRSHPAKPTWKFFP